MEKTFEDTVLSSRVRLARNLSGQPFPGRQTQAQADETLERVCAAVAKSDMAYDFNLIKLLQEDDATCLMLVEQHLISPDLLKRKNRGAALINKDKTISVMVGEEDHLRIQAILPGYRLEGALGLAGKADDAISARETYAFSPEIGYLTACPTNVGTGMRASLMLHLPALTMAKQIEGISQALGRVGLTVRGFYGEGSQAHGSLYQLSNQVTLGQSELEIIKNLETTAQQVIERETGARRFIHENNPVELEDRLLRSYGVLKYAKKLSSGEMLTLWSDVRLALSLDIITGPDKDTLDKMLALKPAELAKSATGEASPQKRDELRARRVQELLA